MPREKKADVVFKPCPGGFGYGRRQEAHSIGKVPDVICVKCKGRLGCSACLPMPKEISCARCHNWGTRAALLAHGNVVTNKMVGDHAMKIIIKIHAGTYSFDDGMLLLDELFRLG